MSDTPRTDDEQYGATGRVSVDFARTLERELTAAQARIAELEKRLTSSERARQSLSDACDSLQAEMRELKADLERTRNERNRAGMEARQCLLDNIKDKHICELSMDLMGKCFFCGKVNKEIEAARIKEEQERNDPKPNTPPPAPKNN